MATRGRQPKRAKVTEPVTSIDVDEEIGDEDEDDEDGDGDEDEGEEGEEGAEDESENSGETKTGGIRKRGDFGDSYDIFEHGDDYVRNGVPVRYTIKKDAGWLEDHDHPYSWSEIQQSFGPGFYQVAMKRRHTGLILSTERRHVLPVKKSELPPPPPPPPPTPTPVKEEVRYMQPEPMNILEMMSAMQRMSRESQSESREAVREAQNAQTTLMAALVQMVAQPKSDNGTQIAELIREQSKQNIDIILKLTEMNAKSIEAVTRGTEKMIERVMERIEKMESGKSPSGLSYSPQQILELQMQAQKQGFEMWAHAERLAESKAEQKLAILEGVKANAEEEVRPKSMVEKLVDMMLPMAAAAAQSMVAQPTARTIPPAQLQSPAAAPKAPAQPRPPVQPRPPTQPRPPVQPRPPRAPVQPRPPAPAAADRPKAPVNHDSDGLPKATPMPPPPTPPQASSTLIPPPEDVASFQKYMEVASQNLMESWGAQKPIEETCQSLLSCLGGQGIEIGEFLRVCTCERVTEVLRSFNADENVLNWIGRIYAHLEAPTTLEPGG